MPTRRPFVYAFLFVALCSLAGGLFGPNHVSAASTPEDQMSQSLKAFTKVYDLVEQNFADPVKADKAVYNGAIPGMLHTLDPHSSFFDPKTFKLMREDQRGHYYGVGMQVGPRNGKTIVIEPFAGTPAYKAGLRPGDVLLFVNDKNTEGMTTTEIADTLKGPRNTPVQIVVSRQGEPKPLTFNLMRDEIPRNSIKTAFFIKPGIAFIDIDSFTETTSRELEDNLKRLGESNIQGLILDLRANPGGLLNEGVDVAGHFLKKGDLVVSHRGRASAEKPYTARRGNGGKDYPVVVLVNRYSASAAEIVAGALQDHDRAWILGENTFGKGLVQTVYPLNEETGLALTTAHYYTPSGRLIQRDYSNISFLDYYYHKNLESKNEKDVKMTDSGRTVYGGGGISPDEKFIPEKYNKFQIEVLRKYGFFNFSSSYFGGRDSKLPKGWEPDQNVIEQFKVSLKKSGADFTDKDFNDNLPWIKNQVKREMYITAFSIDESLKVAAEIDPMVMKAIESLPKAKALVDTAKKLIVQRMKNQNQTAAQVR